MKAAYRLGVVFEKMQQPEKAVEVRKGNNLPRFRSSQNFINFTIQAFSHALQIEPQSKVVINFLNHILYVYDCIYF